jgi:hypothetical protein
MIKILEHRMPKANKEHVCEWCCKIIEKGIYYHDYVIVDERNKMHHYKIHGNCERLWVSEDAMLDGDISQDEFQGGVKEFLYEHYMPQMNRMDIEHLIDNIMADRDRIDTMNLILEEKNDK